MGRAARSGIYAVALIVYLTAFGRSGVFASGPVDQAQLIPQYKSALESYRHSSDNLQAEGVMTESFERPGSPTIRRTQQLRFARNGGYRLLRRQQVDGEGAPVGFGDEVFCVGGDRCFQIQKKPKSDNFIVKYFGNSQINFDHIIVNYDTPFSEFATSILGKPILALLDSKEIRITAAESLTGAGAVKFSFRYRPHDRKNESWSGWWLAHPGFGWAIQEYECRGSGKDNAGNPVKMVIRGTAEYGDPVDGTPAPRKVTVASVDSSDVIGELPHNQTVEFTRYDHIAAPVDEFRLRSYGLGGMEKIASSYGSMTGLFLFGLAALALAISIKLRVASRRNEAGGR